LKYLADKPEAKYQQERKVERGEKVEKVEEDF